MSFIEPNPSTPQGAVQVQVPLGDLLKAQAHWVTRDTILWNIPGGSRNTYTLHYDPGGNIRIKNGKVTGGQQLHLQFEESGPTPEILKKYPQLSGYASLELDAGDLYKVPEILQSQVAISARDTAGILVSATSLQIPGVLDDLFFYDGPLGITYQDGKPTLQVWAPTAQSVSLELFATSTTLISITVPMNRTENGVWEAYGTPEWTGKFYLYRVQVFVPLTGQVETNQVTDPYSISLSANSKRSQIIDLNNPKLTPSGWEKLGVKTKPPLEAFEDAVIYELHVRDFSFLDPSVPEIYRGTYKAFTMEQSYGSRHLKTLAASGLTHVHLLPVFDFATVEEDRSKWAEPDFDLLSTFPGDSPEQQAINAHFSDIDGYNWGYDPLHYTTPEGSYSTNPDGSQRIIEFREMVQALNQNGLRVVMDVVYNHAHASGQNDKSVLDRIVPGYYHRLNADGQVEMSSCCPNTASEHKMMEKLMIDSLLTWATAYKVDGFRFDLMGHHMLENMVNVRKALDSLTPEKDGIDGKKILIYGEGWNFGEVANNTRGKNATQQNISGSGIGVFNDRIRDAARGGGAYSTIQEQGFITGLYIDPNGFTWGSPEDQKSRLLYLMDIIRLSLAGNLKDYQFQRADGRIVRGSEIDFNGQPAGFTADPQENIIYVDSHDNETLFDAVQLKAAADANLIDRVRMHNLGISLVLLGQGIPFIQGGSDLLRSKSLDRNSYNSGDWFNQLDFTYRTNNWAVGLPPAGQNQVNWPVMQPLLANPNLKPTNVEIFNSLAHFQEMLQIRKSSPLFRLRTAEDIQSHVKFLNTGPSQIPGLIVMSISDDQKKDLDQRYEPVTVLFNANSQPANFNNPAYKGFSFELHPVQAQSQDQTVRSAKFNKDTATFTVPGRTTAVFVSKTLPTTPAALDLLGILAVAALAFISFLGIIWCRGKRSKT